MTPIEFKRARAKLGLSVSEMADALGLSPLQIRRMEMPGDRSSAREVQPPVAKLIIAYLHGYRPKDWPVAPR